jgi:aspartokinase
VADVEEELTKEEELLEKREVQKEGVIKITLEHYLSKLSIVGTSIQAFHPD